VSAGPQSYALRELMPSQDKVDFEAGTAQRTARVAGA
jgi:hypothetical protein